MIKKLLCWLWGHKTVVKAYTGETMIADGAFDRDVKHPLYRWERSKFCTRCGKSIHQDEEAKIAVS